MKGTKCVIHIVPLTTFGVSGAYNLESVRDLADSFRPMGENGRSYHYNFDGFFEIGSVDASGGRTSYLHLFRDGAIETVTSDHIVDERRGVPALLWGDLCIYFFECVERSCAGLSSLGIAPPYAVMLSLLGVRGSVIITDSFGRTPSRVDRDDLLAPEIVVETSEFEGEWHKMFRPALDAIWNAYGFSGAINFDAEGRWRPKK